MNKRLRQMNYFKSLRGRETQRLEKTGELFRELKSRRKSSRDGGTESPEKREFKRWREWRR